jgi:hypothetical protein
MSPFILVSHIKGRTATEGVRENGAEEVFWLKSEEETGHWRKLRDEELQIVRLSKIWRNHTTGDEMCGTCDT